MKKRIGFQFLIILVLIGTNLFTYYHLVDTTVRKAYQNDHLKHMIKSREVMAKALYETTKGASFTELKALALKVGEEVPKITKDGEPVIRLGPLTSFRFKDNHMIGISGGDRGQPLAGKLK